MAPELEPACGKCGAPLPRGATDAGICGYACAFSARSADAMVPELRRGARAARLPRAG